MIGISLAYRRVLDIQCCLNSVAVLRIAVYLLVSLCQTLSRIVGKRYCGWLNINNEHPSVPCVACWKNLDSASSCSTRYDCSECCSQNMSFRNRDLKGGTRAEKGTLSSGRRLNNCTTLHWLFSFVLKPEPGFNSPVFENSKWSFARQPIHTVN